MVDSLFSVSEPLSPTSNSLKEKKNNSKGPPVLGFPLGKGSKHPQETSMSLHILSPPPPRHQSRESRKQPDICEDVTGSWLLCRGLLYFEIHPKWHTMADTGRDLWSVLVRTVASLWTLILIKSLLLRYILSCHVGPMLLNPSLYRWFPTGVLDQYAQPFSLHDAAKGPLAGHPV